MMPIDYKKYPANWKSEIRPRILERACNKCEVCGVPNGIEIIRGLYNGIECYQDIDSNIYISDTSEYVDYAELGILQGNDKVIKVVLTIAHLDHDTTNNSADNLKAMCQKCHLRYDAEQHAKTRKENSNKNQIKLFGE